MDAPFLTKLFLIKATELFSQAEQSAKGDEVLTRRVERAELPTLYVGCVRGPEFVGEEYHQAVAKFERIARREKIVYLQEGGPDFETKLTGYKSRISKPTTKP
jgi:hypothetical protein